MRISEFLKSWNGDTKEGEQSMRSLVTGSTAVLEKRDLQTELWREYDFAGRVYRINNPVYLFFRPDGTTHRILDDKGIAHCCPAPGEFGCVIRWQSKSTEEPVTF